MSIRTTIDMHGTSLYIPLQDFIFIPKMECASTLLQNKGPIPQLRSRWVVFPIPAKYALDMIEFPLNWVRSRFMQYLKWSLTHSSFEDGRALTG